MFWSHKMLRIYSNSDKIKKIEATSIEMGEEKKIVAKNILR